MLVKLSDIMPKFRRNKKNDFVKQSYLWMKPALYCMKEKIRFAINRMSINNILSFWKLYPVLNK